MDYLDMLLSALGQGLLYAPMAMGVFIAFRVLNTPDLTVDGSFVFGMTACAVAAVADHPVLAILAGMLAGALAGWVTGALQTALRINPILSGILTMTGLYTVNYAVLGGRANLYLQRTVDGGAPVPSATLYRLWGTGAYAAPALTALIVTLTAAGLIVFFKTRWGMAIRATGDNEEMVRSSSINAGRARRVGISMANALVGLSGALVCQHQRYADLSSGNGTLVVGLASVIIGLALFGRRSVTAGVISAVAGSMLYRLLIQAAYLIEMPSYMVKLISAAVVVFALVLPLLRAKAGEARLRRGAREGAE